MKVYRYPKSNMLTSFSSSAVPAQKRRLAQYFAAKLLGTQMIPSETLNQT